MTFLSYHEWHIVAEGETDYERRQHEQVEDVVPVLDKQGTALSDQLVEALPTQTYRGKISS